jgi:hypothetical protein
VQLLAGDFVTRGCSLQTNLGSSLQDKEFKGLQELMAGREAKDISVDYCNTNLCNGSSRLAEISTMKILFLPSIVFLTSFFSRL